MKRLVILAYGDNVWLHQKALDEAVKVIADINGVPVIKSWVEDAHDDD